MLFRSKQLLTQDKKDFNTICRTYLTVPEDMSTSMLVNYHARASSAVRAYVYYSDQAFAAPHTELPAHVQGMFIVSTVVFYP